MDRVRRFDENYIYVRLRRASYKTVCGVGSEVLLGGSGGSCRFRRVVLQLLPNEPIQERWTEALAAWSLIFA